MRDTRSFLSWQELATKAYEEPPFLINPYVPSGGIVFCWGATSTGKSPLGWEMARAIGSGEKFFELPTRVGKVLYIELDTPERLVAERLQKLPTWDPPSNGGVDFLFLPPLSVPVVTPADMAKLHEAATKDYSLVLVNTLRKTHSMNDKEAATPKMVYEFYQRTFPGAALIFVHHTKKAQLNPTTGQYEEGLSQDSFSGAKNWINDAQVGLQLRKFKNAHAGTNLQLRMEKSQVSAMYVPMLLRLEVDGSKLTCPEAEAVKKTRDILAGMPLGGPERLQDERIASTLGVSLSTARTRRLEATSEIWLKRKDEGEDEG